MVLLANCKIFETETSGKHLANTHTKTSLYSISKLTATSVGQAVTMGGKFTRAGMPGSVVTNNDCAVIKSMIEFVDPVNCCKSTFGAFRGEYNIGCSPDGGRVEYL
ncbi:hypothetical protein HDU97_006602 [Phlyctochytrium planicorne]|nr:hypothetical protein HDU97_006602 [Phlyctochytrium planicorne]